MEDTDDDVALLVRWQETNDADAGRAFFDRYSPLITRFLRNKVNDGDRDDLIQQTFIAARSAKFAGRAMVRTWLLSIAWRKLADHFRKQARRGQFEFNDPDALSVADMGQSPQTKLEQEQERRLLLEGLRRLPLHQQAVLELHYWEGLSVSKIAEALEIPLGTAKTKLRDGRIRLTTILEEISASDTMLQSTLDDLSAWSKRARRDVEFE